MKPTIFLAHSKKDRKFIEKLANDLRIGHIDVWYDEWEIPPGESFRKQIFEEGITKCDLFFVYLTPNSIKSYWVNKELDAAFIRDAELKGGFMALFVDLEETREQLSLDLKSLHGPVLNKKSYERPVFQLISKAWEANFKKQFLVFQQQSQLEALKLQKNLAELQTKLARLEMVGAEDSSFILTSLKNKVFNFGEKSINLADIFLHTANIFALGTTAMFFRRHVLELVGIKSEDENKISSDISKYFLHDILGPLVILRIVDIDPAEGEILDDYYYLTEQGKKIAAELSLKK